MNEKKGQELTEDLASGMPCSKRETVENVLEQLCHWKKNSSTSATSILQMMKQNSLSLSAAKKLLRSCLPKPCTVCRKKIW